MDDNTLLYFCSQCIYPGMEKTQKPRTRFFGLIGITLLSLSAFVFGDECCAQTTGSPLAQNAACTDAACTDAACGKQEAGEAMNVETSFQFATFTNWLSPLGGLFLVIGHIANHRKNCTCSSGHCCLESDHALRQLTTPEK